MKIATNYSQQLATTTYQGHGVWLTDGVFPQYRYVRQVDAYVETYDYRHANHNGARNRPVEDEQEWGMQPGGVSI